MSSFGSPPPNGYRDPYWWHRGNALQRAAGMAMKRYSSFHFIGHALGLNLGQVPAGPPDVTPPPPPPDTTASMLREISRAQTDQQIRATKRRSIMGGY